MALYMDRHDLPGMTPEQVAQAHVLDLEISGRHGVRFLSYWFDSTTGAAFCLADAPGPEAMQAVHHESHGMVANEIISVSEDRVLKFLGAIRQPDDHSEAGSAFRTILFTDIRGSTTLLHAIGQAAFMVLLTEHDLIIRRALLASGGREVKHTGDGIMASFDEVTGALDCASAIQDGFDERSARGGTPEVRVRIGLAAGEPVEHNDDIFGATVNLASRICEQAEGGQILVSGLVRQLGEARGFAFRKVSDLSLRGFPEPTPVFELERSSSSAHRRPRPD